MVEGEISRLENQINQLQADLDREKKVNKQSKSVKWQIGTPNNNNFHRPSSIIPNDLNSTKGFSEKMGFDTKALHFISKAMKGDYNLNDYSVNEKLGFSDQKENQYLQEEVIKFQERVPRKSGMLKPSSPLRDPRSHTPKVYFLYLFIHSILFQIKNLMFFFEKISFVSLISQYKVLYIRKQCSSSTLKNYKSQSRTFKPSLREYHEFFNYLCTSSYHGTIDVCAILYLMNFDSM